VEDEPVVVEEIVGNIALEDDEMLVQDNVVDNTAETEDGVLSADEVQSLYDSLGTWSAVADHLGITTATLRKYREELGLL